MIIHLKTTKNRLKNKLFAKTRYNASSLQDYKCKNKIKQLPKFIVYVYVSDIRAVQYDINFQAMWFQPKPGNTKFLDSFCPHSLFNPNDKKCIPWTIYDTNRACYRYNTNTTFEYITDKWGTNSDILGFTLPCLQGDGGHVLPGNNNRGIDHHLVA